MFANFFTFSFLLQCFYKNPSRKWFNSILYRLPLIKEFISKSPVSNNDVHEKSIHSQQPNNRTTELDRYTGIDNFSDDSANNDQLLGSNTDEIVEGHENDEEIKTSDSRDKAYTPLFVDLFRLFH